MSAVATDIILIHLCFLHRPEARPNSGCRNMVRRDKIHVFFCLGDLSDFTLLFISICAENAKLLHNFNNFVFTLFPCHLLPVKPVLWGKKSLIVFKDLKFKDVFPVAIH